MHEKPKYIRESIDQERNIKRVLKCLERVHDVVQIMTLMEWLHAARSREMWGMA